PIMDAGVVVLEMERPMSAVAGCTFLGPREVGPAAGWLPTGHAHAAGLPAGPAAADGPAAVVPAQRGGESLLEAQHQDVRPGLWRLLGQPPLDQARRGADVLLRPARSIVEPRDM
ncbi:unnamed protein product, partial [Prorocentrum cordatum]